MALQQQDQYSFNSPSAQGGVTSAPPSFGSAATPSTGLSFGTAPSAPAGRPPSYSFASMADGSSGGPASTDSSGGSSAWLSGTPGTQSGEPAGRPPTGSGPSMSGASPTAPAGVAPILQQLQRTQDPAQKAVLQDQLARGVYSSLKDAGHDVKWQGDQLIVDGRPYVLGDGTPVTSPDQGGIQTNPGQPGAELSKSGDTQLLTPSPQSGASGGAPSGTGYGGYSFDNLPPGVSATDPRAQQYLSIYKEAGVQPGGRGAGFSDIAYMIDAGMDPNRLRADLAGHGPDTPGPDGVGRGSGGGGAAPSAPSGPAPQQLFTNATGSPNTGIPSVSAPGPAGPQGWQPGQGPKYTPDTSIGTSDVPNLSFDQIRSQTPTTTPGQLPTDYATGSVGVDPSTGATYSFGGLKPTGPLGPGITGNMTEEAVANLLRHPESMDPETVARMKAASKDELAQMEKQQEEDITREGYLTGNQDSNFVAAQRLGARGARDQSLIASNRAIDMQAATTNLKDRQAAAQIGQSFATAKDDMQRADAMQRLSEQQAAEGDKQAAAASAAAADNFRRQGQLANEGLRSQAFQIRQAASQQNIDNAFKSDQEKMAATQLASDITLKEAAAKNDRTALIEGIKQKAAQLGQSADSVMSQYVLGLAANANQRYGIDVGASIDRAKLDETSIEFRADLAYRFAALDQQNQQFGVGAGLSYAQLNERANEFQQGQYDQSATPAGG